VVQFIVEQPERKRDKEREDESARAGKKGAARIKIKR
jgi:hypothetical protein